MKWIGQHIYDLIARFRNDVYLEDISSGTITSGGNLGLDSNNKIVKASASGGISFDGSTANGVLTYKDADEASVEANLTFLNDSNISTLSLLSNQDTGDYFSLATTTHGATTLTTVDDDATAAHFEIAADGNITLDAAGDIVLEAGGNDLTLDADNFTFTSATSQKPLVTFADTANDADGSRLIFSKNRGAAGQDADLITAMQFKSYNDAGTPELINYGQIIPKIHDASDGVESGQMIFQVQAHGGGNENGLVLTGGSQDDEVDVEIGLGSASVTKVHGTLTMGSTATINNSGVIQVAAQSVIDHDQLANYAANEHFTQANITTVGTIGTGVWQGTAIASAYLDADTAHYSAQKQFTYHGFTIDMDTTKQYIGLLDADSETTSTTNGDLPIVAPVAGKLLKVFLRVNKNQTALTLTFRLETQAAGVTFGTGPTIVGTQSGAGPSTSSMVTYDFTSSLDSGDNVIDAGDTVYLSIQSSGATSNTKYYITCLWEWDLSSV